MQCASHLVCSKYGSYLKLKRPALTLLNQNVQSEDREELLTLQHRLESKIQVIAPSIDMIELMSVPDSAQ
jgi:hypothetical protein